MKREVYDYHDQQAAGADEGICYGFAYTAEEACALYAALQSPETNAAWVHTAEVINGVWGIISQEREN